MTEIVTTVPIAIKIQHNAGVMFWIEGGGQWHDEEGHGGVFGMAGGDFVAYLPDGGSLVVSASDIIDAALAYLQTTEGKGDDAKR